MTTSQNHQNYLRRRHRTRTVLSKNQAIPRLSVFRSLRHIFAQIIDDQNGQTLASSSDLSLKLSGNKTKAAEEVGKKLAELAKTKKIEKVRFDRGAYRYHGRVAALGEAARKNGLQF
jgi:large subunit ribosomal protein L18